MSADLTVYENPNPDRVQTCSRLELRRITWHGTWVFQ